MFFFSGGEVVYIGWRAACVEPEIGQASLHVLPSDPSVMPWSFLVGTEPNQKLEQLQCVLPELQQMQRRCSICHALVFVGTRLNQESDNFKVPLLRAAMKQRRCSICHALVFVGTGLNQKSDNFNVPFLSCCMNKGVAPSYLCLWSLFAPNSHQKSDNFNVPFPELLHAKALLHLWCLGLCWHRTQPEIGQLQHALSAAAACKGVPPSFVHWSVSAPDSTRNWTTSRCPSSAAENKGVAPSVMPWSLFAPNFIRNRTTSTCPFLSCYMNKGVAPSLVVPWSLLAPDSTRNRTTSIVPFLSC